MPRPTESKSRPIVIRASEIGFLSGGNVITIEREAKWVPCEPGKKLPFSTLDLGLYHTDVPSSGWVLRRRRRDGVWSDQTEPLHCPFGEEGDCLWVKEPWVNTEIVSSTDPNDVGRVELHYKWDKSDDWNRQAEGVVRWRPAISMPRWASRITLKISKIEMIEKHQVSGNRWVWHIELVVWETKNPLERLSDLPEHPDEVIDVTFESFRRTVRPEFQELMRAYITYVGRYLQKKAFDQAINICREAAADARLDRAQKLGVDVDQLESPRFSDDLRVEGNAGAEDMAEYIEGKLHKLKNAVDDDPP